MSSTRTIEVVLGAAPGGRLDRALAAAVPEEHGLSRSRLRVLIEAGAVAGPDGRPLTDPAARPPAGARLAIRLPAPRPARDAPEAIPLAVVFEDDDVLVVDKPAGLVVHPAPGAEAGTLVNALLHHLGDRIEGVGGARRPGIVHRLDKETSGLLVVAKTGRAHAALAAAFHDRRVEREYLALAWGAPDPADPRLRGLPGIAFEPDGTLRIAGAIGRHPTERTRMAVRAGGRPAVTRARTAERFGGLASLLACRLETGRTHQIRVHLAHVGHPLIGDPVYGRRRTPPAGLAPGLAAALAGFRRQALHAARLGFAHPVTGAPLAFGADPPADFTALLALLRNRSRDDGLQLF